MVLVRLRSVERPMALAVACLTARLVTLPPVVAAADQGGIDIVRSQKITASNQLRFVESWVAVSPKDSRNLIAAAMALAPGGEMAASRVVAYSTSDGGTRWAPARTSAGNLTFPDSTADPHVVFDELGSARLAVLQPFRNRVLLTSSTDGGRTWRPLSGVTGVLDRPWLATSHGGLTYLIAKHNVDVFGGPNGDLVYVARFDPRRNQFLAPRYFLHPNIDRNYLWSTSSPTAWSPTSLVVPYVTFDIPPRDSSMAAGSWWTVASPDSGRTFSAPRLIGSVVIPTDPWEAAKTAILGRLYVHQDARGNPAFFFAWVSYESGAPTLLLARSADAGRAWEPPSVVARGAPGSSIGAFNMAVTDSGTVGLAWYDFRDDPAKGCFQLYFAVVRPVSRAIDSRVISQRPTCSVTPFGKPRPERFANGGDTLGLVALRPNSFMVVAIEESPHGWSLLAHRIRHTLR